MGKFIKDSWLVIVASLFFGLLVAGVNGALKDRIDANKIEKRDRNIRRLLGDNCTFEEVVYEKAASDKQSDKVYYKAIDESGNLVGYCFASEGPGFADRIELLIAVDANFELCKGIAVMYSQETPGFGDKIMPVGPGTFSDEFIDSPCPETGSKLKVVKVGDITNRDDKEIVAITGATITSDAVTRIVNKTILEMKNLITE